MFFFTLLVLTFDEIWMILLELGIWMFWLELGIWMFLLEFGCFCWNWELDIIYPALCSGVVD